MMAQRPMRRRRHAGFTLLDLVLTVAVMAIMAGVLVPMLRDDDQIRIMAASRLLVSDLETAQAMTIDNPQDPVIVKLHTDGYYLARAADPGVAIDHPDAVGDYEVTFGGARGWMADGVRITIPPVPGSDEVTFNAQGGLSGFSGDRQIELRLDDHTAHVHIARTTGDIQVGP